MSFRYNSRIDRARSRLTLTSPDHSQSVLKIAPSGPPDLLETSAEADHARRLCRALAGAGDRRPYHPRRRALHGHGPLTRVAADRSVRLSVDRHPRSDHHRAVDGTRRRAVPGPAAASDRGATRRRPARASSAPASPSPPGARSRWWCARRRPSRCNRRCWSAPSISRSRTRCTRISPSPGLVKTTAAALIALTLFALGQRAPIAPLLALAAIELAAATLTTHAAARLDHRTPLLLVEFLHQFGAAIWIGGIPCFLLALSRVQNAQSWRMIGARFSRMSMAGVACIVVSGLTMSLGYIGDWEGFYGTAYGVMVGAKIAMFLHAARSRRRQLPADRAVARAARDAGHAAEALRRGGDRHRCGDLLRGRLAHLGAAGDRSHAGPRHLARDRRAEHAAMAAVRLA